MLRNLLPLVLSACLTADPTPQPLPPPAQTLTLAMDPLVPGEPVDIEVFGARPGDRVQVVRSDGGVGPCPRPLDSLGNVCIQPGTTGVLSTLSGRADVDGIARWSVPAFPDVPDSDWSLQAAVISGDRSLVSNVLQRSVRRCDEPTDAVGILANTVLTGQSLCTGVTYAITVPAGQAVRAVLGVDDTEADLDLRLRDATGATLASSTAAAGDEAVSWRNDTGADAVVRLRVSLFEDRGERGSPYDLDLRIDTPLPCVDDALEDDDDLADAAVPDAPPAVVCDPDVDLRRIDLLAGEILQATVTAETGDGELVVALLDDTGTVLLSDDLDPYGLAWVASTDQTVYLRVRQGPDDALGGGVAYGVTVDITQQGVCADDPSEDDDTQATAVPLTGGRACPGDPDWRTVPVLAGERVALTASTPQTPGNDLILSLVDETGTVLATGASEVVATATADATWALRVDADETDPAADGVSYDLDLVRTPAAPCVDDAFEDDDDRATAIPLPSGRARHGVSCPGDDDLVGVFVPRDGIVRFTVDVEDGGAVDLSLLDALGNLLDADTTGPLDVEAIAPLPGLVYARVAFDRDDAVGGGVPYLVRSEVLTPAPCPTDPLEDDDVQGDATWLERSSPAAAVACEAEEDWFYVDADPADTVILSVDAVQAEGTFELALFDVAGTQLVRDIVFPITLTRTGPIWARTQLLRDDPVGGGSPYTLTAEVRTPDGCVVDAFEPDDDRASATPLPEGLTTATACTADADLFTLDVLAGERIDLTLDFEPQVDTLGDQDVDWMLSDGAGAVLFDTDLDATAPESLSLVAQTDDTWVLEVFAATDDLSGGGVDYSLDLVRTPPAVCPDDASEDDDTLTTAVPTLRDAVVDGVACLGDPDHSAVDLLAGEGVSLSLSAAPSDGLVALELLDASGQLLDADVFPPLDLIYGATADEIVIVRVSSADDPTGDGIAYTLELSPLDACPVDALEPDDTPAAATAIGPGTVVDLSVCEAVGSTGSGGDWFAVDLLGGERLDVDVRFDHDEGDLDARLTDSTGTTLLDLGESVDDDERLSWTATTDSTVLVHVYLFADRGTVRIGNDYDLVVSVR